MFTNGKSNCKQPNMIYTLHFAVDQIVLAQDIEDYFDLVVLIFNPHFSYSSNNFLIVYSISSLS